MICCSENAEMFKSMARISRERVIAACRNMIAYLKLCRAEERRKWILDYVKDWNDWIDRHPILSRVFFYKKITRRDAIRVYLHGYPEVKVNFPQVHWVHIKWRKQSMACEKMLNLALASENTHMFVSEEGIDLCGL